MEALVPATPTLTVNKGGGSGRHASGAVVRVIADEPPGGKKFARWSGDTEILANPFVPTTTATMPSIDVTITATYADE
jgi:Divergent InlB B-repeat domain